MVSNQKLVDSAIKYFTNNDRSKHDTTPLPDWYKKKMAELGVKYKTIRWLPLDIPKIQFDDFDEFLNIWDRECIDSIRLKPCPAEPWTKEDHPYGKYSNYYKPQFKSLHFYTNNPDNFEVTERGNFAYRFYSHPIFNKIVEQLHDLFPFQEIIHARIWESLKPVYPHRDETFFWRSPTEIRIMLYDKNTIPTLYIADIKSGNIIYIDLKGLDTNTFCWSNGTQVHGSDFKGARKHLICIDGIIDPKKLEDLLDRSIIKYKDKINYNLEI